MLVSREELRFDFGPARFDPTKGSDRKLLGWIFNQFLYGEVTGIQCGHWLYRAPSLQAAAFLAKQATEELSHVKRIARILSILNEPAAPAHRLIRFLSTGQMGANWGEHVCIEMALGEGLVLGVFYALADTVDQPEIKKILEHSAIEEERHVEFGERETIAWLTAHSGSRRLLLGSALVQVMAMQKFKSFILKKLRTGENSENPVLQKFEAFYDHLLGCFEKRVDRLGLSVTPIGKLTASAKAGLLVTLPFRKLAVKFSPKQALLTSTYLADPVLKSEARLYRPD